MTHDQLIQMQNWAALFLLVCLLAGVVHLLLGLIRPRWVLRAGRGSVVLLTFGIWLAGLVVWGGTIGYTHSHPNGPHAMQGYLDDYIASECAKGADLPACKKADAGRSATPASSEPAPETVAP